MRSGMRYMSGETARTPPHPSSDGRRRMHATCKRDVQHVPVLAGAVVPVYRHARTHAHARTHSLTFAHMHASMHVRTCARACVRTCARMSVFSIEGIDKDHPPLVLERDVLADIYMGTVMHAGRSHLNFAATCPPWLLMHDQRVCTAHASHIFHMLRHMPMICLDACLPHA